MMGLPRHLAERDRTCCLQDWNLPLDFLLSPISLARVLDIRVSLIPAPKSLGRHALQRMFNVPKNNALASATPTEPDGATCGADYLSQWTASNHVRAAAAFAAAASLTMALCHGAL